MHRTVYLQITPYLPIPGKRSPDGTTIDRDRTELNIY